MRDDQLFRDTSMRQLISQYDYMHTLLASNLRRMFGHLNELLLPDEPALKRSCTAHEAELKDFLGATPAETCRERTQPCQRCGGGNKHPHPDL